MKTVPESGVIASWLEQTAHQPGLVTEEDGPVTILFPGRANDDHGPDFRDALVATREGLQAGDIEVHASSSGWWTHRHHLDPAYNRVILHVVRRHDAGRPAVLANGRSVPTLCLERCSPESEAVPSAPLRPDIGELLPCHNAVLKLGREKIMSILGTAGRERFSRKVGVFQRELETSPPEDVAYRAVMEALGYRRNRAPMRRLALAVPPEHLTLLAGQRRSQGDETTLYEGLLLGAAGLLPSQRSRRPAGGPAGWIDQMEQAWMTAGCVPLLTEGDWHFSRVRPANYPVRRIAAMGRLLQRYHGGLWLGLVPKIENCIASGDRRELENAVVVPASGCWQSHLDFGRPSPGRAPALCGPGRAGDIIVNVLFPLAVAWYRRTRQESRAEAVLEACAGWPGREDNVHLSQLTTQLGFFRQEMTTALERQGLLHIHRSYCTSAACRSCPVSVTTGTA